MDTLLKSAGWVLMALAVMLGIFYILPTTMPAPPDQILLLFGAVVAFALGWVMVFRSDAPPGAGTSQ